MSNEIGARFFYNEYWGFSERPTTSAASAGQIEEELGYISGVINACAADGEVSKPERDYIKGLSSAKGYLPEAMERIDELCDAAEEKSLEEIGEDAVKAVSIGTLRFAAAPMILQAIKAASKDGLDTKEMEAIEVIAAKMGVSKELLKDIMAVVADEEEVKKRRIALCTQNHHNNTTTTMSNEIGARFFDNDYWGFVERPTTSAGRIEEELGYISGVINACAADGKVSKLERDYIKGLSSAKGYLPEAMERIDELCDAAEEKSLEEIGEDAAKAVSIGTGTLRFAAPPMILQAIKAASKDGLDTKEMEAIEVIAAKMGVSKELLKDIKAVVADEEEVKKKRIALCTQNHPCLDEKYKK